VDERGVSDVVGFVLVFALVTATVGVVYTTGIQGLTGSRDVERVNNAERAFDVFANNVDDVIRRGAPSRATEVKLADADLHYGAPVTVNLTLTGSGKSYAAEFRPIVYGSGTGSRVVYSDGAVIREQRNGAVLIRDPPFVLGEQTVVPYLVTRPQGVSSVAGSRTVLIRTVLASRHVFVAESNGPYTVRLNVTSARAVVWKRYLEGETGGSCALVGDTATCTFQTQRVYVPLYKVDVQFI